MATPDPATDWRVYGDAPLPRVLAAALEAFAEQGYHGTSIRVLAERAGLSVPTLYHYHRSKQDTLVALMMAVMDELLERCRAALASAGDAPGERFDAIVESMLRFHMFRRAQAFIGSSEIRSLEPDNRAAYVARRDELQRLLDEIVVAGVADGTFATPHPADASRAVASLCVGVAAWYREDGELPADDLVARHLLIAHGIVGAR